MQKISTNINDLDRLIDSAYTADNIVREVENNTYVFFTYMCPRLYDLRTVVFWILEKDAHNQSFKANLRHIAQDVIVLSNFNIISGDKKVISGG